MSPELLVIILSVIALVGFGLGDVVAAYLSRQISSARLMFIDSVCSFLVLTSIFLFTGVSLTILTPLEAVYVVGAALCAMVGLISQFQGLSVGKAGVVVPIANSYAIVSVLLGIAVLGEKLLFIQIIASAIIIVGLFLLSVDFKDVRNTSLPPVIYALLALVGWGFMTFFLDRATETVPALEVAIYNNLTILTLLTIYLALRYKSLFGNIDRKQLTWSAVMSILFTVSFLSFVFAFSYGKLSLVSVITAASPLVTAIVAHRFLGDRLTIFQYAMIGVVIGGIMLLVW